LDKVKGISLSLAHALAPHIDWNAPVISPPDKKREWVSAIIVFSVGLFAFTLFWDKFNEIGRDLNVYQRAGWDWLYLWMNASIAMNMGLVWLLTIAVTLHYIARTPIWSGRISTGIKAILWSILGGTLSLGISNFIYYQFTFPPGTGWELLFTKNQIGVLAVIGGGALFLLFLPAVVNSVRLKIISDQRINRLYHFILLFIGLVYTGYVLFSRQQLPFFFQIAGGIVSFALLGLALFSLTTGMSFQEVFDDFFLSSPAVKKPETDAWLKWLNTRLPDAEQQRELKKALDIAYPPSKIRTLTSVLFITVSGWIILQSLGAVIEWVIQKWLENLHLFQG
jgi:hypothetical protein